MGLNFSEKLIDKAIELSSFNRLQSLEEKKVFQKVWLILILELEKNFLTLDQK